MIIEAERDDLGLPRALDKSKKYIFKKLKQNTL
jgi:hypothetical protein